MKFERQAYEPWSDAQDRAIETYYPTHGPSWEGWSELLPTRTKRAIQARANRLGVTDRREERKTVKREKPRTIRRRVVGKDPNEEHVMRCMHEGMAPSQIDKANNWRPGKSVSIVTAAWNRDKESSLDAKRSRRDTRDD